MTAASWRGLGGIAAVLLLWQVSVWAVALPPYFYPSPVEVWRAFLELMRKGILPAYVLDSLSRYVVGVSIGLGAGIALGIAIGLNRVLATALSPVISFCSAIVEVAWIPIFVIWFGYGYQTILIALTYVVFFPVLFNTVSGVRSVPQVLINGVLSLGASRGDVLREVVLPAILPNVFNGFRIGAGFAFRGLIFAEMIAAKSGVGYLIFEGVSSHQTDRTIVGMICMGLGWLGIDRAYLRPLERITVERWGLVAQEGGGR